MTTKPAEAPALFSLLLFLGLNYMIGFGIGQLLTGSTIAAAAIALAAPCLSLLGIALFGTRPDGPDVPDAQLQDSRFEDA